MVAGAEKGTGLAVGGLGRRLAHTLLVDVEALEAGLQSARAR